MWYIVYAGITKVFSLAFDQFDLRISDMHLVAREGRSSLERSLLARLSLPSSADGSAERRSRDQVPAYFSTDLVMSCLSLRERCRSLTRGALFTRASRGTAAAALSGPGSATA